MQILKTAFLWMSIPWRLMVALKASWKHFQIVPFTSKRVDKF